MKKIKTNRNSRTRSLLAPSAELIRYAVIAALGLILACLGAFMSFQESIWPFFTRIGKWWDSVLGGGFQIVDPRQPTHFIGGIFLAIGVIVVYSSAKAFFNQLNTSGDSSKGSALSEYIKRQNLARGPRIVAIGGGTGLSTLLRGLKQYSSNITAIVTVSDDGGSSGRLVKDLGIIPPGDLRNCLIALADAEKRMTDVLNHRFSQGSGDVAGHSMGNLLIATFIEQAGGDVDVALQNASEVLAIRGRVIPSTTHPVTLKATMEDGEEMSGETAIVSSHKRIRRIYLNPEFPKVHPEALKAIREADLVCIGPGSVYTSIVPNLLVPGMAAALEQTEAIRAYVCNVMTQPGESDQFTAAEHIVAIQANVPTKVFDYVLVNTGSPSQITLNKYHHSGQEFVAPDIDRIKQMGFKPVPGNLMSETDYVRHDPARVANLLIGLFSRK